MSRCYLPLALAGGLLFAGYATAQTQPLNIKEGFWEVTTTSHVSSPEVEQAVEHLPPAQRAQVIAAIRAAQSQGTVESHNVCLSADDIRKGNILMQGGSCPMETTSSSSTLAVHLKCSGLDVTSRFERVDAEHFTASVKQVDGASPPHVVDQTVRARWLGSDCAAFKKEGLQSQAAATGANRDVLAFLPYIRPGNEGRFGRYFTYFWGRPNPAIPVLNYLGGFPGGPKGQIPQVYFHGTDGSFLYVTVPIGGGLCSTEAIYWKVDRAGAPTKISRIPKGLWGGRDQLTGGPPCH